MGGAVSGRWSVPSLLVKLFAGVAIGALPVVAWGAEPNADSTDAPRPATQSSTQSYELPEVVVTAQRREQSLLSVPIAVSAVTADKLEKAGVSNSTELSAVVPNLQINSAFGDAQPNFTLRGVGVSNEFNANQASPIGVYVDDAYMAARTLHGMQLFDLERVEVLRGPQGTLYGRNTTGGAINFITRSPDLAGNSGYVAVGAGNFGRVDANGAFEATLAQDVAGVRFAFNYIKHDGYFDNKFPGARDAQSQDDLNGRITLRVKPVDQLDVRLKLYAGRSEGAQNAVQPFGTAPDGTNPITGYSRNADGLGFFDVDMDQAGRTILKTHGALLTAKLQVADGVQLSSLTSYDLGRYHTDADVDGSPFHLIYNTYNARTSQFNQELRLNYSVGALDLVVGGYYGWDDVRVHNLFDILFMAPSGFGIGQNYLQKRKSYAVFSQADVKLSDHWSVSGGLRYTKDEVEYENGQAYLTDGNETPVTSTLPTSGPYDPDAFLPTLKRHGDAVTGRAALSYTTDGGRLLYASYSRGYRAGVFNGNATDVTALTYVEPETVNAYELGAKGRFMENRVTASVALFYYDYQNQQLQDVVAPFSFLRNAPKSTLKGLDAEFQARPTANLKLDGSLGLLDAKYDELTLSGTVLNGNRLPFAPIVTASAGFDWRIAELFEGDVSVAANADYASRQWYSPFNDLAGNQRLQQKAFTKVNASLTWQRQTIKGELWVKNLLEEKYYTYGLDIRSLGVDYLVPAPPRTFGATIRYEF